MSTNHGIPKEAKAITVTRNADGVDVMQFSAQFEREMQEKFDALSKQPLLNGKPNPFFGAANKYPDRYKSTQRPVAMEISLGPGDEDRLMKLLSGDFSVLESPHSDGSRVEYAKFSGSLSTPTLHLPNANCNRDCMLCEQQFCTAQDKGLVRDVSNADAKGRAKKLAVQAEQDRQYLQDKLERYGDAIKKKWGKMGREKRRALMLGAQPSLYRHKWQELRSMWGYDKQAREVQQKGVPDEEEPAEPNLHDERVENGSLSPFLNLESLMDDRSRILSLLHYRAAYKLEDWVMFDSFQAHRAAKGGNLSREYNENCVIMFGERYGDLVKWHREQCHRWNFIGYPRAIIVLKAQASLFGFLRKLTDDIVPSNSTAVAGNSEWMSLVSRGFKAANQNECWSAFSNQPFSAPPTLNPAEISRKVLARLQAAEDHLRFLQTDPAYFHRLIAMHRKGEHSKHTSSDDVWASIAQCMVVLPIAHIMNLRQLIEECTHVQQVRNQYESSIAIGKVLPNAYDRALGALEVFVIRFYQTERRLFAQRFARSPAFQRNQKYHQTEDGRTLYAEDPLFFAISRLRDDAENDRNLSISFLMTLIEDLLAHGTTEQRGRIDQGLYDHIGRISVLGEILDNLRKTRPLTAPTSIHGATEDYEQRSVRRTWMDTPPSLDATEIQKFAALLEASYKHPMPVGKKDAEWLTKATTSRQHLSDFWAYARQVRRSKVTGTDLSRDEVEADVALLAADQSEEYFQEVQAEQKMVQEAITAAAAAKARSQKETVVQSTWGANDEVRFVLPMDRVKSKTRPEHEPASNDQARPVDDEAQDEGGRTCIPVNSESLRIFACIFPNTAGPASKGVVQWKQVVTAMTDAGFSATHTGGSAVSFERKARDGADGAIVFHKPHPDTEMDNLMLRVMGKRLKKWFGWDEGTFVEREKVGSK
ncbi:hypothetical protein KC343_g8572 [Hortaea werneckii]|nr:hypothetical protein KC352_g19909 [Hortaea werneckii]KAI7560650.1 hypothetical protein KC317_g9588 [Hortaea werneckii]KAI7608664.1 hypothetical protein KC346_g9519 [Hortaea werneckii]KAI7619842.1 hypothetical protein KC343_g8572 [Hortaea werneckii]KAI7657368.1 hypothetical protein KC319_g9546 [Hortaea werneckii]